MTDKIVPLRFQKGEKFIYSELENDKLIGRQKVDLRIDPNGHILYWKPIKGEMASYAYAKHCVSAPSPTSSSGKKLSIVGSYPLLVGRNLLLIGTATVAALRAECIKQPEEKRHSLFLQDVVDVRTGKHSKADFFHRDIVMEIVENIDFVHPKFTFFSIVDTKSSLIDWIKLVQQLARRARRTNHGLLYHFQKILAPALYTTEKPPDFYIQLGTSLIVSKQMHPHNTIVSRIIECLKRKEGKFKEELTDERAVIRFLIDLTRRKNGHEIMRCRHLQDLFDRVRGTDENISREKLLAFMSTIQRDPRKNTALYPPMTAAQLDRMLLKMGYDKNAIIDFYPFMHIIWSDNCADLNPLDMEFTKSSMNAPLSHYYINSSHNTYCTGTQCNPARLVGGGDAKADVEIYRQVLLSGCRCIELDVWDSSKNKSIPIITHGPSYLMGMNEISLKDVCHAIMESAFKASEYPVLLSIENHLSTENQKRMVLMFKEIFRSHLLVHPLSDYPLLPLQHLPPPEQLRFKIIVKARKAKAKNTMHHSASVSTPVEEPAQKEEEEESEKAEDWGIDEPLMNIIEEDEKTLSITDEEQKRISVMSPEEQEKIQGPVIEEETSDDLSKIVNYLDAEPKPHKWNNTDLYYVMCSVTEDITKLIYRNNDPANEKFKTLVAMHKHTKHNIVRVYPRNTRVMSDNYSPIPNWGLGVQMVALNFQKNSLQMLFNHAMFEKNGGCGYVLKPICLTNPLNKYTVCSKVVPDKMPVTLKITVIAGMFYSMIYQNGLDLVTSVRVDLYDFPLVNGTENPVRSYTTTRSVEEFMVTKYAEEEFEFEKVLFEDCAFIHITLLTDSGKEIAHRVLPVDKISNGYRHVMLRTLGNRNLGPACIFVLFDAYFCINKQLGSIQAALIDIEEAEKKNRKGARMFTKLFDDDDSVDDEDEEEEEQDNPNLQVIYGIGNKHKKSMMENNIVITESSQTIGCCGRIARMFGG